MMITQHSVIINNYRMIKRLSPAHAQMTPANQRSFKTIVSDDLVGRSLMLFRVENLIRISKKYGVSSNSSFNGLFSIQASGN
jgi:hypothetical protein